MTTAEQDRDAALNLIGRIASGEGGGFNWAVRMAQEWSTARTERLVRERDEAREHVTDGSRGLHQQERSDA